jgi:hypothetical protein
MNKIIIICVLLIIFVNTLFFKPKETFEKKHYDCIISINVHEKFSFLLKQFQNISENVKCNYAIILNCNEFMLNECSKNVLPEHVYVYDEPLEKNRFHGSITEGIYRNMKYALSNFTFEYFIVASSRNMFDNSLKLSDLKKLGTDEKKEKKPYKAEDYQGWWWSTFANTSLYKHYQSQDSGFNSSPHEGLVLKHSACEKIVSFLEEHQDIKQDLFNYKGCVEEFALQSIAVNEGDDFYYIGNGWWGGTIGHLGEENSLHIFMYKTWREEYKSKTTFMRCDTRNSIAPLF